MKINRRGQSMVEILIAIAVMVIGMTSSASIMTSAEVGLEQHARQAQAIALAEEGIQGTISICDRSWTEVALGAHGLAVGGSPIMWVFSGTSDVADGFTRVITVSAVDANTKKVVVIVTCKPTVGRTASVELQMLLTDWPFI